MYSKNFSSKDISKNTKIKGMLQSFFIEEYCPKYKDIKAFDQPIDNELSQIIEKDLHRKFNLFIHYASCNTGSINVVDDIRKTLKTDLLASKLCTYLQDKHKLSLGQANYIAIASAQGGIGGCYPSNILSKIEPDIEYLISRPGLLSQIIIHPDKSVQYVGGQVICFDISQAEMSELLAKDCGTENYLMRHSNDHIVFYVVVNLGVLGQNFTKHPKIEFNVAGTGEYGQKFLAELNTIKTKKKLHTYMGYNEIVMNYENLSESTLYDHTARLQRYKSLAENTLWYKVALRPYPVHELDKNNIESKCNIDTQCMPSNQSLLAAQDEDHFINESFFNSGLKDINITQHTEARTKFVPTLISFLFNRPKLLGKSKKLSDSKPYTFYIDDIDENNDQVQTTWNHDTLDSLRQLFAIVEDILSYTVTSDYIKKLQIIINNYKNNKIKEDFISKLCTELDKNQLHKLNCLIMQTMNELASEEDDICVLNKSDDRIWRQLLFSEAKHCGMKIELSCSKSIQELAVPEIPREILQLYKILTDTFYNKENRKSDESIADKVAKSIYWLFINPLMLENEQIDWSLYFNLLKVPNEYTKLLSNSNILSMITCQDIDNIILPNAKITTQLNNIMSVFKESIIDILSYMLQEAAIKDLNMVISEDMITDTIRPHLDTKTISYLLNNKQQIINDSISLLNTVYSQDPARIMLKLLSLNHQDNLITPQDINKQVTCKSYNEFAIPLSEDLLVYNQDSKDVSLVGMS